MRHRTTTTATLALTRQAYEAALSSKEQATMTSDQHNDMMFELEEMVDKTSLYDVLSKLEQICHEKADHVEGTWQDRTLARQLRKCATAIGRAQKPAFDLP